MKRFVVFRFPPNCPQGGLNDIDSSFETLTEAKQYCRSAHLEDQEYEVTHIYQILDSMTTVEYRLQEDGEEWD